MAITQTPRLKLQKQASGDANWHTGLNDGLDNADLRLVTTGAGSPVGAAEGFFVGAFYVQTSPVRLWICTVVGTPGTWVDLVASGGDILAALVLANTIALQGKESGGTARNLAVMSLANKVLLGALTNLLTLQTNGATALKVEYGSGEQTVWHAGNDGAGSGLDADTLDGLNSLAFMRPNGAPVAQVTIATLTAAGGSVAHLFGGKPNHILFYLEKVSGAAESGWVVGDRIYSHEMSSSTSGGLTVGADATNVYWGRVSFLQVVARAGGAIINLNPPDWKLVFSFW